MKSNKIKYLAAVVALATSGSAFAAYTGTTGNSSVLFNAYESVSGYTFAWDTGLRKDDINSSFAGISHNLAADANWNNFLSVVGASHVADIKWNLIAADTNSGSIDGDPISFLTTGPADGVPNGTRNAQLNSWVGNVNSYITAASAIGANGGQGAIDAPGFVGGDTYLHLKDGSADYASYEIAHGPNWNTKATFDTTAGLGQTLSFYEITKNGTSNTAIVNAALLGTVTLSSAGELTVSPVPEAETWAMLLAGLALVGTVARRRSNALS
ncbi:FxDxF family PEP-CTERM protein [Nitrosospira sp. NpAV]|uniref:FxDxF family PEP-CTERM protein n=1 Tax=Nitrosospira sp. NpAV TaxID=58133 RepID=UPI000697827A|nr:FxDxF family PEP-CTERM protein [Nitrosospira sp. NpAV]